MNFQIKGHAFSRTLISILISEQKSLQFCVFNDINNKLEFVEFNEKECCRFLEAITEFNIIQRIPECVLSEQHTEGSLNVEKKSPPV